MPTVVTVDDLPLARREAVWRDAVCDTFVRLECAPARGMPLQGRIEAGVVGNLHVSRIVSSAQRVQRTRARAGATRPDEAFVLMSVQLRGRTIVRQGRSEVVLSPGGMAFYDATRPYTLTTPAEFEQIVLHLPHRLLEASVPGGLDHMAERLNPDHPSAQALLALAPALLRMIESARPAIAERSAAAAEALITLALDSLCGATSSAAAGGQALRGSVADALVRHAHALMASQLHDPKLSPARLAAQLRVSLRRLQEVFQAQGSTLSDSLWQMRLEAARGWLASPQHARQTIGAIAYHAGFSDLAHFSRRFRQGFGMSPSEYRLSLR